MLYVCSESKSVAIVKLLMNSCLSHSQIYLLETQDFTGHSRNIVLSLLKHCCVIILILEDLRLYDQWVVKPCSN